MRIISLFLVSGFFLVQNLRAESLWTQSIDAALAEREKQLQELAQKKKKVYQLLSGCEAPQDYTYLITWFEWQELAISEYVRIFDRTRTIVGMWGLEQLTKPLVHSGVIMRRQEGIVQLDRDPDCMRYYDELLLGLKQHEDDVLSYYDEHDELHRHVEQLYYSYFKSVLNTNKFALDYAYVFDSCHAVANIASLLCITGLVNEFVTAQFNRKPMDIVQGIKKGFGAVFHDHSLDDTMYQTYKAENEFVQSEALSMGSVRSLPAQLWAKISQPAVVSILLNGSFGDKQSYFNEQTSIGPVLAFLWVLGQTAYQDHRLWLSLQQNYTRLIFLHRTHVALQHRLWGVAHWCAKAHELCASVQMIGALQEHPIVREAYTLCVDGAESKIKKLFTLLRAETFAEKNCFLYSRGHVLITHALMQEIKGSILPLMQAVGIIDGYISICRVYKTFKNDAEHPFCLVHFDDNARSEMKIVGGWLPLITKNRVHNSILLGGEYLPRNMVLTGPNGGGKSCILKLMGGVAVLAHSWGIVPAQSCSMHVLTGLRTSFNPPEDISQGLSTFTAQKKRLDQLCDYARTVESGAKLLFLIDEPYRGTIDAEAEKRAYQLGSELAQYHNCMTAVASHLQAPIELAESGDFINRHMEIIDNRGVFERTFKLCDGVARWWFNDIEKRMRFIDWLHSGL